MLQPEPPITWVEGPPIKPYTTLLTWLDTHRTNAAGARRYFRLPVVVHFATHQLGIEQAFVGETAAEGQADGLRLALDDSGMGIALLDRLRRLCPKTQPTCVVWLIGIWGPVLSLESELQPPSEDLTQPWPFAVRRVEGLVPAQTTETPRVYMAEG